MIKRIRSLVLFINIQVIRVFDHTFRYLTGLPTTKRSMITPQIYLGGQYAPRSIKRLQNLGVTAIVNMRTRTIHQDTKGIKVLNLPTRDKFAPTLDQLKKGSAFISQEVNQGGKVYIHCLFGEERGATMTIAYLISTGLTFEDALTLVKQTRSFINPVPVQIARLKEFEALK